MRKKNSIKYEREKRIREERIKSKKKKVFNVRNEQLDLTRLINLKILLKD